MIYMKMIDKGFVDRLLLYKQASVFLLFLWKFIKEQI